MDEKTWCALWDRLCVYYDKPINTRRRHAYFLVLGKYEVERVRGAIDWCVDRLKWFPTVSEIRGAIPPIRTNARDLVYDDSAPVAQDLDCSHLSDEIVIAALKKFSGAQWGPEEAELPLRLVRAGNVTFCQAVKEGLEQLRPTVTRQGGK